MCSKRTTFKCRFGGCGETFRTAEGRNYHEEMRHQTFVTPTIGTTKQMFDLSHVCNWDNKTEYQLNVMQDRLTTMSSSIFYPE